jgi:Zinc finger, C2H2 type
MCGAPFASAAELVDHMKTVHKDADPTSDVEMNPEAHTSGFLCGLCGRRFATAEDLADHNLHPHLIEPHASPVPAP